MVKVEEDGSTADILKKIGWTIGDTEKETGREKKIRRLFFYHFKQNGLSPKHACALLH